jgi:SAM-dependent methyltransferase
MGEAFVAAAAQTPPYDQETFDGVRVVRRRCPLCDGDAPAPVRGYGAAIWQLQRCRNCGFVYLDRAPDYAALAAAMAWEKTAPAEVERRARLRPVSHRLSRLTRARMRLLPRWRVSDLVARYAAPGNVVDLGCGVGTQWGGLAEAYVPYGIEVSVASATAADRLFRSRGGRVVSKPSLEGLKDFAAGFFSAAVLRSYLEHELAPLAVLRELRRTLAPGGIAIVKVPNYASLNRRLMRRNWCGFRYPDHLNYFTPASLRSLGEAAGYRVHFGLTDRLPTSDNMYALLTKA